MDLHKHLADRNLDESLYSKIWFNYDENCVTFPLWNLSGQLVGYQQYRPYAPKERENDPKESRYYTYHRSRVSGLRQNVMWGLESLRLRSDILVVVEGVFDACILHRIGIPSVALLNGSSEPSEDWLYSTGRKIYKVEDNQGKKGNSHKNNLGPHENVTLPMDRGDMGECTLLDAKSMFSFILYK